MGCSAIILKSLPLHQNAEIMLRVMVILLCSNREYSTAYLQVLWFEQSWRSMGYAVVFRSHGGQLVSSLSFGFALVHFVPICNQVLDHCNSYLSLAFELGALIKWVP